jgi:tRNA (mo5U34)-methyltransferase
VDIDHLTAQLPAQIERMRAAREAIDNDFPWYPYDILGNVAHLDAMLTGEHRNLDMLAQGQPVVDIGAADGDLAFTLEQVGGWELDIIDTAPTNMNGLRGAKALRDHFRSSVQIHDIDLDQQFVLPRPRYGLVLLLGILYHLQNPYYAMKELASRSAYCVLNTKVARFAGPLRTPIADLPVGYLVAPEETNNDPTNFWIFSPAGLERLVNRTGWDVLDRRNVGNTVDSDPSTPENDERMLMLLRSRHV